MEEIILENSNMQMTYDIVRGGFVSVKSPIDDYFADFVITPEEFPQYDVEYVTKLLAIFEKEDLENSK